MSQLHRWLAYNRIEPIGYWRGDHQAAVMAAGVSNTLIGLFAKRGTRGRKIADFMPDWKPRKITDPQAIWGQLRMAAMAMGAENPSGDRPADGDRASDTGGGE